MVDRNENKKKSDILEVRELGSQNLIRKVTKLGTIDNDGENLDLYEDVKKVATTNRFAKKVKK